MQKSNRASELNIFAFWKAQQKAWKITVIRTSLERLGYNLVLPYLSLFIILLGANKTQLGLITSAGLICAGLLAPLLGQHIDRHGPKRMYLFGIFVLLGGYIALSGAKVWQIAAIGMFLHQIGRTLSGQSCANICGNCLANCDRAKGMLVCETLAAGVLGMVGPMIAGWFLVNVMKVSGTPSLPEQIRPLFIFPLVLTAISLLLVIFRLHVQPLGGAARRSGGIAGAVKDAVAMVKADKNCLKWILMVGVGRMPQAMIIPYLQLYAAEVKGASVSTLAAMTTATALTSVVCGYFIGVLSDKFGRKVTFGSTLALYIIGLILLVTASGPVALVIVGALAGFQEIGQVISGSIQHELVPAWARGRWSGVNSFVGSMVSAAIAAVAGAIYDGIGAHWLFIIYIVCELVLRVPLLLSMPETLNYKVNEENFAALKK